MVPTTRLHKPSKFKIHNGTKDPEYEIAHNIAPSKGEQLGDYSGSEFVTVTLRKVAYS